MLVSVDAAVDTAVAAVSFAAALAALLVRELDTRESSCPTLWLTRLLKSLRHGESSPKVQDPPQ